VSCISDCVLNVLKGNVELTGCVKRKLSKQMLALRRLVDRCVPLQGKKLLIVQRGFFLLHQLTAILPTHASLIYQVTLVILNKMFLVLAEEYHPPAKKGRHRQHPHTEWINLRNKHRDAELRRNARTKETADYINK